MTQTPIENDDTTARGGRFSKSYDHIVGLGEAMVRLSVPIGQRLETAPTLSAHVGGAELNGLIAATAFGMPSTWVSAVGDDLVGERIVRHARTHEVTPVVQVIDSARSGLYFVEMAPYPRSTRVSYDRTGSAASLLDQGSIDWGPLITQHTCFYSTGITAAISESARRSLEEAIQYARSIGAVIAFDINYRRRLWSPAEAVDWMMKALPDIDVLSVSSADLEPLGQSTDDLVAAREALGVDTLVVSTKERTVGAITVTVCAISDDGSSEATGEAAVVDALGAGDAMFGAFLAAAPKEGLKAAVDQALKASLITYGIHGDAMDADPRRALDGGRILR